MNSGEKLKQMIKEECAEFNEKNELAADGLKQAAGGGAADVPAGMLLPRIIGG